MLKLIKHINEILGIMALSQITPITKTTREPNGQPQAILFDWDNTLVDTFDLILASINHALARFDKPLWTMAEAKQRIQGSAREKLPILFGDHWEEAMHCYASFYREQHLNCLKPLEGAEALLKTLQSLEIPVGLVSNKNGSTLRKEVDHLAWQSYFVTVIGAGDAARDKPSPDIALLALQNMNVQPSQNIWLIGDAPVDWQCAEAAGCLPITMGDDHPESQDYPHGASDCFELIGWFSR